MSQKPIDPPATPEVLSDSLQEKSPSRSWRNSSSQRPERPAPSSSSRRRRSQASSRSRCSRDAAPTVWDVSTWTRPSPTPSTRGRSPRRSSARGRTHSRDRSPLPSSTRTVVLHDRTGAPSPQPLLRSLDSATNITVHVWGSSESTLTADSPTATQSQTEHATAPAPSDRPPARSAGAASSHRAPAKRPEPTQHRVQLPVQPPPRAPSPPRDRPARVALPPCTPPPPGPGDLELPRTPGNYSSPEVEPVLDVTRLPRPRHLPAASPATSDGQWDRWSTAPDTPVRAPPPPPPAQETPLSWTLSTLYTRAV